MSRRGLTLLETMLTLALLVGITVLAWPALEKPLAMQRLQKSADQLHADLTRARAAAIRTGQTQQLSIDATTGRYSVVPVVNSADASSSTDFGTAAPVDMTIGTVGPGIALPEGVRLALIEAVDDVTPAPQPVGFAQPSPSDAAAASQTVYFHPDGTTSTARIVLVNDHDMALDVQLRGLTGAVAKGEPYVYVSSTYEVAP